MKNGKKSLSVCANATPKCSITLGPRLVPVLGHSKVQKVVVIVILVIIVLAVILMT